MIFRAAKPSAGKSFGLQILQIGSRKIVLQVIPRQVGVDHGVDVCGKQTFQILKVQYRSLLFSIRYRTYMH